MNSFYKIDYYIDLTPRQEKYKGHTHECYEILIFLQGDSEYVVDGILYSLEPYDTMLIPPGIHHQILHKSQSRYERIVIYFDSSLLEFCSKYQSIFEKRGECKISGEILNKADFLSFIERFRAYTKNFTTSDEPIMVSLIIETMYLLYNASKALNYCVSSEQVRAIISYINKNFKHELSLNDLAKKFYISKYHLCRIFKAATGTTVNSYITKKRIENVKILCQTGAGIGAACDESGFCTYSAFYNAYKKETGKSPKEDLQKGYGT